jgi:hypothetical protein
MMGTPPKEGSPISSTGTQGSITVKNYKIDLVVSDIFCIFVSNKLNHYENLHKRKLYDF